MTNNPCFPGLQVLALKDRHSRKVLSPRQTRRVGYPHKGIPPTPVSHWVRTDPVEHGGDQQREREQRTLVMWDGVISPFDFGLSLMDKKKLVELLRS